MTYELKDCVKGDVVFRYYRKGELFYQCENGFVFRVPISDTGDASFNSTDRAMLFMRWIRKELASEEFSLATNIVGTAMKMNKITELKQVIEELDNGNSI